MALFKRNPNKIKLTHAERLYQAIIIIIVGLVTLTCLFPLIYVIGMSFTGQAEMVEKNYFVIIPENPTLLAYQTILKKSNFWSSFLISVFRVLLGVPAALLLTVPGGYILANKQMPGRKWFMLYFIVTMVLGGGTIACILGSNTLNKKQIASLSAAYMALGKSYQQYRRQVAERIGAEEEEKLRMEAAKETKAEDVQRDKDGDVIRLFYEPASKRYFHATMSRVIEASYYFNRELATNGCISVNEWCNYLCADELTITPEGDQMGWCLDQLIYDWDAYWMDFEYDKQMTDDGLECYYLAPALDPVENYLDYTEDTYHA